MDPEVVIDPARCICVLGPQVTAEYLASSPNGVPSVLSYRGLVESGINRLLELERFANESERQHRQTLLKNAYELEPSFAAHKVAEALKTFDCYEQWLSDCFAPLQHARPSSKTTATLEWLQGLKARGLALAYTHYDSVLDNALNTTPLLLDNEEVVVKWASGKIPGLLHLHGIASLPASVKLDCLNYEATVGDSPGAKALKQLCRSKHVILLGFDDIYFDPCVANFTNTFVDSAQAPSRFPILVTASTGAHFCGPSFLTLRLAHRKSLDKILSVNTSVGSNGLFSASHASLHHNPSHPPFCISLCYTSASSPLLDMALKQLRTLYPNACFSLSLDVSCPVVSMSFGRSDLRQLWRELFIEPRLLVPLHSGLLGFILDDDSIAVWVSSRPKIVPSQHHPMITPIWATPSPITCPVASSKMVSSSSSFQHQTLPSSLLSSMQHFMADASTSTPSHHTSTLPSLYAQLGRMHQQPRRMQSDNQIQSLAEDARRSKNGLLFHHASTPAFPYIKEPLVGQEVPPAIVVPTTCIQSESSSGTVEGRLIAVPSPHMLKTEDGSNEHRIEYIDQYQQGKVAAPSNTRSSSHCKRGREGGERTEGNEGGGEAAGGSKLTMMMPPPAKKQMVGTEFDNARLKFIAEAREWSQKIEETIGKKTEVKKGNTSLCSQEDGGGEGGSEGSMGCSREEQERFLQKHFANLQPTNHTPSSSKVQTPHNSPLRSSSPSHTHPAVAVPLASLGWGSSSKVPSSSGGSSSLMSGGTEGAKLPGSLQSMFLNPSSMGVLPYLTSGPSLQTASALLCNPALLNSYAALQMMSSGGKPVLLGDLHGLQSLQNYFSMQQQNADRLLGVPSEVPSNQASPMTTQSAKQSVPHPPAEGGNSPPQASSTQENVRQNHFPQESAKPPLIPRRRRSNSLPGGLAPLRGPERREPMKEVNRSPSSPTRNEIHVESSPPPPPPPPHAHPPPLIQLPKELRQMYDPMLSYTTCSQPPPPQQQQQVNDPMLSYTTPSQGSPLGVVQFGFVPNNSFHILQAASGNHEGVLGGGSGGGGGSGEEEEEDVHNGANARETGAALLLDNSILPPFPAGRGPIQLWQFLLDLLTSPDKDDMIRWTGNGYEFHILQPEEVARLWGARKNKPKMNYDKLSRGLRYYYSKGIMDKVPGKKLTFKYTCDVQQYIQTRSTSGQPSQAGQTGQTGHPVVLMDEDSFHSDDEPC